MNTVNNTQTHSGWVFFVGLLLVLLGVAAIGMPFLATVTSIVLFGWLLVVAGLAQLVFSFINRHSGDFFMHALVALLTLLVGLLIVFNPSLTAMTITFLLAVFFLAEGIFRVYTALVARYKNWGWTLFGGLLSVVLGILILVHWPSSAIWVIGLFIGIDLIVTGWSFIFGSLVLSRVNNLNH